MTSYERDAMGSLCLLAAFADGEPSPAEVECLRALAAREGNGVSGEAFQRAVLRQIDAGAEARKLSTPELRRNAFELAVGICDADGVTTEKERAFLLSLGRELGIDESSALATIENADALAAAPIDVPAAASASLPPPLPGGAAAIIPVQMKMVYSIGKRYGYSLDSGHIKDLLATVGVGVTSQVVESFGRRIVGGLVESIAGRLVGGSLGRLAGSLTRGAGGAAFTFASTYALGQVARQYYAGGRTMSAIDLKAVFTRSSEQAKGTYSQFAPAIERQASSLNPARLLDLVRA